MASCLPSVSVSIECALDRLERDDSVARVEDGGGRQVDLLARLGLHVGVDVGLADHRGGQLDAVEYQSGLVSREQVDDDLILLEHLDGVLDRLHRLDGLGPVDAVGSGDRRGEPEDDQHQPTRDHQAGDEQASIELALRTWRGRVDGGIDERVARGLDGGVDGRVDRGVDGRSMAVSC